MKRLLFLSFILLFFACDPPKSKTVEYLINTGGCIYKDSLVLDSAGYNLYADKNGNIYFKAYEHTDDAKTNPVLISRLYNSCEGDSTFDLKHHIDVKTFHKIDNDSYADKYHTFQHNIMSDGGNLVISK